METTFSPHSEYEVECIEAERKFWKSLQLNRMLCEHLLRRGFLSSAKALTEECRLEEFVDIELFEQAHEVYRSIVENQHCTAALRWCAENGPKLRRAESTMEFRLRLKEFIEIVRNGNRLQALEYAQKYLYNSTQAKLEDIQVAMATLAFETPDKCPIPQYRELFQPERWQELGDFCFREILMLYGLPLKSPLLTMVQAGLSTLKTPMCGTLEHRSSACPVCSAPALASELPLAHHSQCSLRCSISGERIDENNPPAVLPNGFLYSASALEKMAEVNDGMVTCLKTNEKFAIKDARSAFFL